MKKIIAFSLWGDNPKYTIGALRNVELAPKIYPGWDVFIYIDDKVPREIVDSMILHDHVTIIRKQSLGDWKSLFWRFETVEDFECDAVIFRDTDSRLNLREYEAVQEWLVSDKTIHIMRDHPWHAFAILGGMWGLKTKEAVGFQNLLEKFKQNQAKDEYGTDYEFLQDYVYPIMNSHAMVHDPFFEKKEFPTLRIEGEFVGQVFDENEVTVAEHLDIIKNTQSADFVGQLQRWIGSK